MARSAFVIGGTGQIGYAVANHLLDRGWEVTLSAGGGRRAPADLVERGATVVALDREESGALAKTLHQGADAVIDTLAYHVGHADQLIELQDSVDAFAVISSASVYCDETGRSLGEGVFEARSRSHRPRLNRGISLTHPARSPSNSACFRPRRHQ